MFSFRSSHPVSIRETYILPIFCSWELLFKLKVVVMSAGSSYQCSYRSFFVPLSQVSSEHLSNNLQKSIPRNPSSDYPVLLP